MIIALSICLINYIKDYILIHNPSINILIISCVSCETICLNEAIQFKVILINSEDNEQHNYN